MNNNIKKVSNHLTSRSSSPKIINNSQAIANKMLSNISSGSLIDLTKKNLSSDKVQQDISTSSPSIDSFAAVAKDTKQLKQRQINGSFQFYIQQKSKIKTIIKCCKNLMKKQKNQRCAKTQNMTST